MQEEPLQGGMLWAPVTRSRSLDATAFYLSSDAGPIMWLMVGTKVTQLADDGAWSLGLRLLSATSSPKFKLQKAGMQQREEATLKLQSTVFPAPQFTEAKL